RCALAFTCRAVGIERAPAKDRACRTDLEEVRAGLLPRGVLHPKQAACGVDHGDLATLDARERRFAQAQRLVEDRRLKSGDEKARLASIHPGVCAAQDLEALLHVPAVPSEALRPEAVRHSRGAKPREDLCAVRSGALVDLAHHDFESIPRELTGAEFVPVRDRLEYAQPLSRELERALGGKTRHGKPL